MRFCFLFSTVLSWGLGVLATGENETTFGTSAVEVDKISSGTISQPDDPVDSWKVYISEPSEIGVFLDGLRSLDADVYFYDSNLELLAQTTGEGPDEVMVGRICCGWYYAYFSAHASLDYYLGVASADACSYLAGYKDYDAYQLSFSPDRTYHIFLTDHAGRFDPDLFHGPREHVDCRERGLGKRGCHPLSPRKPPLLHHRCGFSGWE